LLLVAHSLAYLPQAQVVRLSISFHKGYHFSNQSLHRLVIERRRELDQQRCEPDINVVLNICRDLLRWTKPSWRGAFQRQPLGHVQRLSLSQPLLLCLVGIIPDQYPVAECSFNLSLIASYLGAHRTQLLILNAELFHASLRIPYVRVLSDGSHG